MQQVWDTGKKAARFCRKCGSAAPKGWVKSPFSRKWVGNDAEFDPHTGARLNLADLDSIDQDGWKRRECLLAQRIDGRLIENRLQTALYVQEGTRVLLQEKGEFVKLLEPGRHQTSSVFSFFKRDAATAPRDFVFHEFTEAGIDIRFDGLYAKDGLQVDFVSQVSLMFSEENIDAFIVNVLRDQREYWLSQLSEFFENEIMPGLKRDCAELVQMHSVDELFESPETRLQLEADFQTRLNARLGGFGFEVFRVGAIDFEGEAYFKLKEKNAEVEELRRSIELDRLMQERLTEQEKIEGQGEWDREAFLLEIQQERDLKSGELEHARNLIGSQQAHELSIQELKQQVEADALKREETHRNLVDQLRGRAAETDAEIDDTKKWLDVKKAKEEQEQDLEQRGKQKEIEIEAQRLDTLAGRDIQTLIAAMNPDKLLELHRQQMQTGRTPEELLAAAAAENPEVARALFEMQEAKRRSDRDAVAETRELYEKTMAQLERVVSETVKSMAKSTKGPDVSLNPNFPNRLS